MTNMEMAYKIVSQCLELGVRTFCICPGGRNAPLVETLSALKEPVDCRYFFDERSASFFALGRARRDQAPVAVVTTSGTAVTEMISAAVEAHYTGTPLIFITADRPHEFRETGAPQSIEQVGVFTSYVEAVMDGTGQVLDFPEWSRAKPIHWNVAFEEPLLDGAVADIDCERITKTKIEAKSHPKFPEPKKPSGAFLAKVEKMRRPMLVVSGLNPGQEAHVLEGLQAFEGPIYLEGTSGLREHPSLKAKLATHGKIIQRSLREGEIDGVIRIGSVPTARFWRDLDGLDCNVVSMSSQEFSGSTVSEHYQSPSELWFQQIPQALGWDCASLLEVHRRIDQKFQDLLDRHPTSEWGWFSNISKAIGAGDRLFVGNSLPIRNWDLAADRSQVRRVQASRGANGIDGQLATALGSARDDQTNWALLGDLTTIYDMSSLLLAPQDLDFKLVVINNGGGQIFSNLFKNPIFQNPQKLNFQDLSRSMGWDYILGHEKYFETKGRQLIEIAPETSETEMIQKRYGDLCES